MSSQTSWLTKQPLLPVVIMHSFTAAGRRFVRLDVTDQETIAAAAGLIDADYGRLDVLINNVGIYFETANQPKPRTSGRPDTPGLLCIRGIR